MSKITVPMYVSMSEEAYAEFMEAHDKIGFVSLSFESDEGINSVMLTKISYEV